MGTPLLRIGFATALCSLVVAGAALAGGSVDLHDGGDTHEGIGHDDTKALVATHTYRASTFPVPIGFRPPDGR